MIEDDEKLGTPVPDPKEPTPEQLLRDVGRTPAKSEGERREKLRKVTNKLKGKYG